MASEPIKILAIAGSLRRDSFNLALLKAAQDVAPDGVEIEIFTLHDIPFFNQDIEAEKIPDPVQGLIEKIEGADAVLFATPQYNRSYPGVLKNTIDWISRPSAGRPLVDKPVAIVGATPSQSATAMARAKLEELLEVCKCQIMTEPQIGLTDSEDYIVDGVVQSQEVRDEIRALLEAFVAFIHEPAVANAAD